MFWKIFVELCHNAGKLPTNVVKEIGIAHGSVTQWKNGRIPRDSTLIKIAQYFNVTTEYLIGKEKSPTEEDEHMSEFAKLFPQLSEDEQRLVIAQMKGIINMKEKK